MGVGCAVLGSAVVYADDTSPAVSVAEAISQEVRSVFEKCRSAVVKIEAIDIHGPLSGTGFYIDPNGTVLTSYTVGGESNEIVISGELKKLPARRLVADPRCGVAILKVDAETPFLTLGKSRDLSVAAPVMTIGYPMDLPVSPSFGTVAGFDIKFAGRYFATAHIRANVPVQRGQGGAPLLNLRGEVVGIMISSLDAGSAAFAVPIDAAEKVRKDFVRFGELRPGWLGIAVHTSLPPTAGSTAQIDELVADSPGARAGLAKDDIILEIGHRKIRSTEDVLDAAFFTTAEDELPIKVLRGGQEIVVNTVPADPPNSAHAARATAPKLQAIPTGSSRVLPTPVPLIDR
jgi:S1-C subfamily serine protease